MALTCDRRHFIGCLAGAGAVVATSGLPAFALEKESGLFQGRGRFERLALSFGTVEIGLERPFSVLHISDTHLSSAYDHEGDKKLHLQKRRNETFGGMQEEALRDSLAWAKKNVDYVVMTGDVIDWQSEANFDLVKKYLGEGMCGSMGNHEFSTDMWLSDPKEERTEEYKDLTRNQLGEVYPFDVQFSSQIVNGVNFVTLDDVYGYVVPRQVELFDKEVAKGLPIVLCMHVPFYTDNLWRMSRRFWLSVDKKFSDASVPPSTGDRLAQENDSVTRDFIAYLKREPLLKAILAGHEHFSAQDEFSPTAMQYVTGGNYLFQAREVLFI